MSRILLVEDDESLIKLYRDTLRDVGYEVIVAKTGQEGLSASKAIPDLIILDIMLPGGMNGFDVLEKLKKDDALKKIPVFVITNLESEEKVARQIGAVDYAVKVHIDPHELVDKIRKILH